MATEAFVPLLLVLGAIFLLPRTSAPSRWMIALVLTGLTVLFARYIWWRLTETVMPADLTTVEGIYIWTLFAIELLAWFDAILLFAFLARRTDRSAEADWHEDRLRESAETLLPMVDIFIATYDEPVEVLERTISGACAIDWPESRRNIWVLDDSRRPWLEAYAARFGVGYLTRPDNKGAKAGNINAAIGRTNAPFILVLDADFVPQRNFLYRTMGFFDDPRIGIVQAPHNFFNPDPMQASLNMSKVMPDDQRFFFEAIMPGRDGYDCAFCCGSNGIIRRAALDEIGGRLPTGSITEDMLLTIELMRRGYVTRYLNERLAFGLAPESINAFFIQRSRWARGGIQILFLKAGPLGPGGLRWHERLFFLPTHWLTQSLAQVTAIAGPLIFLLFGLRPLLNADLDTIVSYQMTTIIATIAAVRMFAPGEYHPLASMAQSVLQAFRLLPVVLATFIKPHGHAFKVTPKGGEGGAVRDTTTMVICLGLVAATAISFLLNALPQTQIVAFTHLIPIVAFWAIFNMIVLLIVAKIAVTPPILRKDERFVLSEPVRLHLQDTSVPAVSCDISLGGIMVKTGKSTDLRVGDWVGVEINNVGVVPARVSRSDAEQAVCGLVFAIPSAGEVRDAVHHAHQTAPTAEPDPHRTGLRTRLIERLFTTGLASSTARNTEGGRIFWEMVRGIAAADRDGAPQRTSRPAAGSSDKPPAWLLTTMFHANAKFDADTATLKQGKTA